MELKHLRESLLFAFSELRMKSKVYAKTNLPCCTKCGLQDIYKVANSDSKFFDQFSGYVFWHENDEIDLQDGEDFYLSYGSFLGEEYGPEDVLVGEKVCEVLKEFSIPWYWNRNPKSKIKILVDQALRSKVH